MRTVYCFLLVLLAFASGCQNASKLKPHLAYSYSIQNDQYVVISVQAEGRTESEAKAAAMRKAAEVTLDNGYRYFSIESEEGAQVMQTTQSDQSQMPGNLYNEYIQQKQFGKEDLQNSSYTSTYPAIRLVINCYQERPTFKRTYDAQSILDQG